MIRLLILTLALLFLVTSCSKDKDVEELCRTTEDENTGGSGSDSNTNFSFPNAAGTYWVYDYFKVDSLENRTPAFERDTVWLLGNTIVEGVVYQQYSNLHMLTSGISLRRETFGNVVDENGTVIYSTDMFNVEFSQDSVEYLQNEYLLFHSIMKDETNLTLNVPYGNFNCINRETVFYYPDFSVLSLCGDTEIVMDYYLADGIGEVKQTITFVNMFTEDCAYFERVLVDFYQP
ncbi:MAG: hypothetical protein AB8B53_04825 [Flavobacteriales bacterium]